jgi:hypothetical protein
MPADPKNQPTPKPDRLEAATDQAIAACGGKARDTVKALIVTNEFLEAQISQGYVRGVKYGRFNKGELYDDGLHRPRAL